MPTTSFPKPPVKTKRKSMPSKHSILSGIALILSIAAVVMAGYLLSTFKLSYSSLNQHLTQATQSIKSLKTSSEENEMQIRAAISDNQKNIAQLMSQTSNDRAQQAVAQTTYLIQIAHLNLLLDSNVPLAIKLLKIANHRIETIKTPFISRLKAALEKDIADLSALPQVNVEKLIIQLNQISDKVGQLTLQPRLSAPSPTIHSTQTQPQNWWGRVKYNLGGLRHLFIVRHFEQPIGPLLTPQQTIFLKENIQLKLSQAQWAILHRSKKLYEESLNTAAQWLNQYSRNQEASQPIVDELKSLALIEITPEIPETLKSQKVLTDLSTPETKNLPNKGDNQMENTTP